MDESPSRPGGSPAPDPKPSAPAIASAPAPRRPAEGLAPTTPEGDAEAVHDLDAPTGVLTFAAFYEDTAASLTRALGVTLNDSELAADAINEAMTRAYQRWGKISRYDQPAAWVYRVGLNWALSWKQRRRRERERPLALKTATEALLPRDDRFDEALDALSVERRAVVVCRIYLDWSVADTAAALDIAPGTVKSRLARALAELRAAIDASEKASIQPTGEGEEDE